MLQCWSDEMNISLSLYKSQKKYITWLKKRQILDISSCHSQTLGTTTAKAGENTVQESLSDRNKVSLGWIQGKAKIYKNYTYESSRKYYVKCIYSHSTTIIPK